MGIPTENINERPHKVPETILMTTSQRIEFLANLMVNRIMEDQKSGKTILRRIRRARDVSGTITATT